MSLKKKNQNKKRTSLYAMQMRSMEKLHQKQSRITVEDINIILSKHFRTLELLKFNLFGEDFENYGNLELNGQTYHPNKLSLDYLAEQQNDDVDSDKIIDYDILNSLKKADEISKLNSKNFSRSNQKKKTTTRYNKIFNNKSTEDIKINKSNKFNKLTTPVNGNNLLPKISYHSPHTKLNFVDNYMKYILLKNINEPLFGLNSKKFILKKTSYLKRHKKANKLNNELNLLENKYKNIDNKIKNDSLINQEKNPQFQFRYKYVESKFQI